jgi:hypothetical protein
MCAWLTYSIPWTCLELFILQRSRYTSSSGPSRLHTLGHSQATNSHPTQLVGGTTPLLVPMLWTVPRCTEEKCPDQDRTRDPTTLLWQSTNWTIRSMKPWSLHSYCVILYMVNPNMV